MTPWRVRLTARADADIAAAIDWSREGFGEAQAVLYRAKITAGIANLAQGPSIPGSKPAHPARPGLRRVRLPGRARHWLIYRAAPDGTIIVMRLLHDAMDLPRHLP